MKTGQASPAGQPALPKANASLEESTKALTVATADLQAHDLATPDPGDAEAIRTHRTKRQTLMENLEIAQSVNTHWQQTVARMECEAAEKAKEKADAEEKAAMIKRQKASMKRFRDFPEKIAAPIIEWLEWAEAEELAFREYNKRRAPSDFVEDPERAQRGTPSKTIPPVYEEREIWEDGKGGRVAHFLFNTDDFRFDSYGKRVPAVPGFHKSTERVCVTPERFIPATMPDRYAELLPALHKALTK